MGFEIAEAFDWDPPDVILYPTGGGVGLIGIWKAMLELQAVGWIGDRLPRLVAVQAEGCRPIVDAFAAGADAAERAADPQTTAAGLRVPLPFAHKLVLRILRETQGTAVDVPDAELVEAMHELASVEGIFACPEGAALLPALRRLLDRGDISPDERVVLLNTGNGAEVHAPGPARCDGDHRSPAGGVVNELGRLTAPGAATIDPEGSQNLRGLSASSDPTGRGCRARRR